MFIIRWWVADGNLFVISRTDGTTEEISDSQILITLSARWEDNNKSELSRKSSHIKVFRYWIICILVYLPSNLGHDPSKFSLVLLFPKTMETIGTFQSKPYWSDIPIYIPRNWNNWLSTADLTALPSPTSVNSFVRWQIIRAVSAACTVGTVDRCK